MPISNPDTTFCHHITVWCLEFWIKTERSILPFLSSLHVLISLSTMMWECYFNSYSTFIRPIILMSLLFRLRNKCYICSYVCDAHKTQRITNCKYCNFWTVILWPACPFIWRYHGIMFPTKRENPLICVMFSHIFMCAYQITPFLFIFIRIF